MTSIQTHSYRYSILPLLRSGRLALAALAMTASAVSFGSMGLAQSDPQRLGIQQQRAPLNNLQVRRYRTTSLSDARADQIFAGATAVLRRNDGAGDVACATRFTRNGNVTAFSTGDGSIDSSAEFNAVIALAGWVKVVNRINWCGSLVPNVIGCAPVPGNSLVVVRFTANLEGILWAHEFGHNASLGHRNDVNAIMYPVIGTTRRRVNASECAAYRAIPAAAVLAQFSVPQPGASDVKSFVRQMFVHGVPYEQASRFGVAAMPALLAMLRDKKEEEYWPNIVVVLGMMGDEAAADALIKFIETPGTDRLSRAHYAAKTSAVMALGYLVNRRDSVRAFRYLRQGVQPESWSPRLKRSMASYQESTAERDVDFSKQAILGLALSGRLEAAQILRSLQQPAATESGKALQAQLGDLVSEALVEHGKISRQGLRTYYRENRFRAD